MIRSTPTLVTAPTSEPITLSEVKAWAKIDTDEDDALILSLIKGAREMAERYMNRALITQTWKLTLDIPCNGWGNYLPAGTYDLPITVLNGQLGNSIDLPYHPLQSITSVVTYDTANNASTYSASNYFADTANSRLALNSTAVWPSPLRESAAVIITYVCGYGTSAAVPQAIKTGMLMHVQKMYDERLLCDIPDLCKNTYKQFKVYG